LKIIILNLKCFKFKFEQLTRTK